MRSLITFLSILGIVLAPVVVRAEPESAAAERSRIADLERFAADQARALAALQREVASLKATSPAMRSRPSRSSAGMALAALAIRTPLAAGAFGPSTLLSSVPLLAYPGVGGGGTAPTTFTGFSGTITSAQMIDPYVPVDGTMNVTGAFTASGIVTGSSGITGVNGTWTTNGAYNRLTGTGGTGWDLFSVTADGASAVGNYIRVSADYTTAGAKIASFGDNAGTSYSEKAYIDLNGNIGLAGGNVAVSANAGRLSIDGTTSTRMLANGAIRVEANTSRVTVTPAATFGLQVSSSGSKVTCDATNVASLFYESGGAGATDELYMCLKAAADTYSWILIADGEP